MLKDFPRYVNATQSLFLRQRLTTARKMVYSKLKKKKKRLTTSQNNFTATFLRVFTARSVNRSVFLSRLSFVVRGRVETGLKLRASLS